MLDTSAHASMTEDSWSRGFGVAPTEPALVADLSSPVLLTSELTTQVRASLALLGLFS